VGATTDRARSGRCASPGCSRCTRTDAWTRAARRIARPRIPAAKAASRGIVPARAEARRYTALLQLASAAGPPTAVRRPSSADRRPPTTDRRPPSADRRPPTTDRRPQTADRRPSSVVRRPPTAVRRTTAAGSTRPRWMKNKCNCPGLAYSLRHRCTIARAYPTRCLWLINTRSSGCATLESDSKYFIIYATIF
jgi:hypothetical protein